MSAGDDELNSLSPITHESVISQAISANEGLTVYTQDKRTKREKIHALISEIAVKHGVTIDEIFHKSRFRQCVLPRHEAMAAVAVAFPELSFPHLGRIFGRDHSSVMHACRKMGLPPRGLQHHTRQYTNFAMEMAKEAGGQTNERTTHELAENVER